MEKNVLKTFNCTKFVYLICGCFCINNVSKKLSSLQIIYFAIMILTDYYNFYLVIVNKIWLNYHENLAELVVFLSTFTFYALTQLSLYLTRLQLPHLSQIVMKNNNSKPPKKWYITQNIYVMMIVVYVISWICEDHFYIIPKSSKNWTWFEFLYFYIAFMVASYLYFIWLNLATLSCYLFMNIGSKQLKSMHGISFERYVRKTISRTIDIFQDLKTIFSVFKSVILVNVLFAYWRLCTGIFAYASYKFINIFFTTWIFLSILVVAVIVESYHCFMTQVGFIN